jgi:hypothetical protein
VPGDAIDETTKAKNEDLFRQVNERVAAISDSIAEVDPALDILCECADVECYERIRATRSEYEAARATPTHFIVLPEHVDQGVEHVVSRNGRFVVVAKEGAAAAEAELSDPRTEA